MKGGLTLFQTSPGFYVSAVKVLKTLWEKENLLLMSNFSFSHSVFDQFTRLVNFLSFPSNLKLSSANSFNLEESKICCDMVKIIVIRISIVVDHKIAMLYEEKRFNASAKKHRLGSACAVRMDIGQPQSENFQHAQRPPIPPTYPIC